MSHEQDGQKNEKIVKLVKQVKTLSKIVNELQAEVDDLKSRAGHNKNNTSTSKEPKIAEAHGPKLNRFQRLNFFRKDNQTKEEATAAKIVASKNVQTTDKNDDRYNEPSKNKSISQQKHTATQSSVGEQAFENKSQRRHRSTQSISFPKEVEFSCIVETCPAEAENNFEDSGSSQESTAHDIRSTCKECHKRKEPKTKQDKIKFNKYKTNRCDRDCPYLVRNNKDDKKKKKKYKLKNKVSAAKTCCIDETYASKNRQCKNKKTMVNFTKNDKTKARKFITNDDNFSFDCKLFENSSYFNEENNHPKATKIQLLDHDGKCIKVKETYCKRCFKKCKTKNVLKINKAILTHDPPVIIMSPR